VTQRGQWINSGEVKVDSAKLNDWMQVLGIFALVASLVFVGLQMKQSQEIALADQYQARAEAAQNMFLTLQESGISLRSMRKPLSEKTPEELAAAYNIAAWGWTQYDNHFYQYNAGFLDDESWEGLSRRIRDLYNNCDLRIAWESSRRYYRSSFVGYVESLDDTCGKTME
jgi:hypothetical protein